MKEWHHCPCLHSNAWPMAAGPQAHVAAACPPSAQAGILRIFAWANPTDMVIASSATAKVFSTVSSSLVTEMDFSRVRKQESRPCGLQIAMWPVRSVYELTERDILAEDCAA